MDEPAPLPRTPQSSGFRRLVVWLAIVVVVGAAVVALRSTGERPAPPPVIALDERPEDSLTRANRLAGIDSTKRNEWVEDIPGADLSRLTPVQAETFVRFANARRCSCGCGFTLAACRRFDPTCEVSAPLVEALLDSVARGLVAGTGGLRERPAHPPR